MDPSKKNPNVLIRRGKFRHRHTGRTSCEDGRSDVSINQGMLFLQQHQKLGERNAVSPSHPPEGTNPTDIWISDI